jgi:hypothetical protein
VRHAAAPDEPDGGYDKTDDFQQSVPMNGDGAELEANGIDIRKVEHGILAILGHHGGAMRFCQGMAQYGL